MKENGKSHDDDFLQRETYAAVNLLVAETLKIILSSGSSVSTKAHASCIRLSADIEKV